MPFDAGSIIARLDLDETQFNRKLDAAERRQKDFERRSGQSQFKLGVSSQEASQFRRQMDQLDRQLTQDAIRRSNSGQGSVLATLLGMSSPSAARAQATQQAQAQKSLLSRLTGSLGGGPGGGGGSSGGGGGGGGGFVSRLLGGIGPQILGMGGRATLWTGLGASALGALPGLTAPLAALGVGGAGLGIAGMLGKAAISPITPLLQQQQAAQQALASATTPQQVKAAQQQLAGVQKALAAQPAALQSIFGSLSSLQNRWQNFTASLAPALVKPLAVISKSFGQLEGPIRQVFSGAMTLVVPFVRGMTELARTVLPLLGQSFRAAAPLMQPLIGGLGKLISGILPGLNTLLRAAAPAVHAFSGVLGTIGSGLGKMLSDFAPAIKASSVVLAGLGKIIGGIFPVIGSLAQVFARTLAPIFIQFAGVLRALEPTLVIVGRVFAALAGAILKDLVSAFGALAKLLINIQPAIRVFANALSQAFNVLENSGVFAVLGDALESIVPILGKLINLIAAQLAPILPVIITLVSQLSTIFIDLLAAGLTTILTAVVDLLTRFKFLVPALAAITAAWLAWNLVLSANPIGAIILAIVLLVGGITLLAKHWSRVWGDIKNWAMDAWNFLTHGWGQFLIPGLTLIRLAVELVAQHWHQAWTDMHNWAMDAWHAIDGDVIQPVDRVFNTDIPNWISNCLNAWNSFWHSVHQTALNVWDMIYNDVWVPFRNILQNSVGNWFSDAVNAIKTAWSDVQGAVTGPVRFVVDHVLNGLISAFDWISGKVGGPHINPVHPFGLATGGRIPGYGGGDRHLALLEGGEAVISKEVTTAHLGDLRAWGVPGFQRGGRVGQGPPSSNQHGNPHLPQGQADPGGGIGGFFHKLGDIGKIMAAIATGNTKALTNAVTDMIPGGTGGAVANMASLLVDIPKTLIKDAVQTLIGFGGGGLSGRGGEIVKYAMSWLGKVPYVWGGTAVPGGADCSGFVQNIYRHFGIQAPRTSEEQGQWVTKSPPVPGGLAFYHSPPGGPDPGHVAIVRSPTQVISQGGGMGPTLMALHGLPLLFTGVPPGGVGGTTAGLRGNAQAIARILLARHGWQSQWGSFNALETREAGWNMFARNPGSGAYGLAQFINGPSEYYTYGGNPNTAAGQLLAMMNYIGQRYPAGPNQAWAHELSAGWYDDGGWLMPGPRNGTGRPEAVLKPAQSDAFVAMAEALRVAQANAGSSRVEQLLEKVVAAIDRNAAATGASVGKALNGATRRAFYNSQYQTGGG